MFFFITQPLDSLSNQNLRSFYFVIPCILFPIHEAHGVTYSWDTSFSCTMNSNSAFIALTKNRVGSNSLTYRFIRCLLIISLVNCSRSNFALAIKTKLIFEKVHGHMHLWYNCLRQQVLWKSKCQSSFILL